MQFFKRMFGSKEKLDNSDSTMKSVSGGGIGCAKCGGKSFEYDNYFDHYACEDCGWITQTLPRGIQKNSIKKFGGAVIWVANDSDMASSQVSGSSTKDLAGTRSSRINEWKMITGQAAIQVAEQGNMARLGTFSAVALMWNGGGKAPSSVKISGSVNCGYCGFTSRFELQGMSGQVSCGGCGGSYNLFNTDKNISGDQYRIVVASVYSHPSGTGVVLPQFDIAEVSDGAGSARRPVGSEAVITDQNSGLEWLVGPDEATDYDRAEAWVKGCKFAGGGWRMPTIAELGGLYVKGQGKRNMNPAFQTTGWIVWSEPRDSSSAWRFSFDMGGGNWYLRDFDIQNARAFGVRALIAGASMDKDLAKRELSDSVSAGVVVINMWDCMDRNKIKAFIDAGGDINARDGDQWTLLHRAAIEDVLGATRNLLEFGANPDLPATPGSSKRTIDIVRSRAAAYGDRHSNSAAIEKLLMDAQRRKPGISAGRGKFGPYWLP